MKSKNHRDEQRVRAWAEPVRIPTYGTGKPNPNPMFLEKRVYQGSSGVAYPHPVIDSVDHEKHDREWQAVFLENALIRVMILPELGGRVQMALDKTNDYHFVYYNRVIKPALVGLTGPWISGGIEFNWPQHHRPGTYEPMDWSIEEHPDGSRTVWCAEIEKMSRSRARHGFRLHPGRAGFDVLVQVQNRTSETQTFLWWANPAVAVSDDYQSVFPPDVHAVMDHGKRDVSDFPIATGVYYKQDYAPGTDISRYRNIPVPTSYMAYHSDYDFVGCYDHGRRAGMLHVANHHLVPGKKQWTWGNGDFGRAWERQLTDEDGPYIELMCGAFTDNQPDFTWLMPGEEKSFTQTFMPYKDIGPACNASRDWVLHLEPAERGVHLGVYAAVAGHMVVELWHNPGSPAPFHNHKNMELTSVECPLDASATLLFEKPLDLAPAGSWMETVPLEKVFHAAELTLRLLSIDRKTVLLAFTPPPGGKPEIPDPATPAPPPEDLATNEELFLNGRHIEQYRHATFTPDPYYLEALRRDPGDSRCNIAMGALLLRRGVFTEAETCLRKAIERLTLRNPNPFDGEAYYHLGLCLRFQGREAEAFDVLYKAAWSEAWKSPALFELARLASRAGRREEALDLVEQSLQRNTRNLRARHLKIGLLRSLGKEVAETVAKALREDPLDPGALHEAALLDLSAPAVHEANRPYKLMELGLDYVHAGFFDEADALFEEAASSQFLALYLQGWTHLQRGDTKAAGRAFECAAEQDFAYAFPNMLECVPALQASMAYNPDDALAAYALGNFWYAHRRPGEAIDCWTACTRLRPEFPTAWRNLGLALMNKRGDTQAAVEALHRAFEADPDDARVLYELDQFRKETACSPAERLALLEDHAARLPDRDDLCVEYVHLLNQCGRPAEALDLLTQRIFHPWEGGEGKTTAQYLRSRMLLAEEALRQDRPQDALDHLDRAEHLPENLGEGRLSGTEDNELRYRRGCVLRSLGRRGEASTCLEAATLGISEPAGAMYYNDQPPESMYFQGLAWRELGQEKQAASIFQKLVAYADAHVDQDVTVDYFAVSLPDFLVLDVDLNARNRQHCLFMKALGLHGLGQTSEANEVLGRLLKEVPDHLARLLLPAGACARHTAIFMPGKTKEREI